MSFRPHAAAVLLSSLVLGGAPLRARAGVETPERAAWTVLFYGAADNSAEESIMDDLASMRAGFQRDRGMHLVAFVDRTPGFSSDARALGADFEGTRLYSLGSDRFERLDGGEAWPQVRADTELEANMGDPETLRAFVRFAKERFPAERYALVFYSHGDGRNLCPDQTNGGDALFPAEITDALELEDSVDLVAFDVCSMGGIEDAYQWRPGNGSFEARAMVASASVSFPWPYARLMERLFDEDPIMAVDPAALSAVDLGDLIVDVLREDRNTVLHAQPEAADMIAEESWACYDLAEVAAVKAALDRLSTALAGSAGKERCEALRGSGEAPSLMNYMHRGENCWLNMPYFDLFELARRIEGDAGFDAGTRELAAALMTAVDRFVSSSFGLGAYADFQAGKNGVYVLFPDGDGEYAGVPYWNRFRWYAPEAVEDVPGAYGRYAWCRDGAEPANGRVENWFELLDSWFDTPEDGGCNGYRF